MRREDQDVWFYRAEQDWVAIRAMLVYPEAGWSQVSFHAQQAAEKCLKAFIAYNKEEPRRTHDLEELLETAIKYDSSLPVSVEDCNYLNLFAVDARYGDFDDEYSEESASGCGRSRQAYLQCREGEDRCKKGVIEIRSSTQAARNESRNRWASLECEASFSSF